MHKNIKWANKELPGLSHDELNKLTYQQLTRIENGKNAFYSGQLKKISIIGGITTGNNHYKNSTGLFGMDDEKKKQTKINGGKVAGRISAESGNVVKAGKISAKSPNHPNNTLVRCPHCDKEGNLSIMSRWHLNNCKHKK